MTANERPDMSERERELGEIVRSVSNLGERARLLSVQLAVASARLQQTGGRSTQCNNDILDLVARVTRLSQSVSDAVSAIEKGLPQTRMFVPGLWSATEQAGLPGKATLDRLTSSLNEATLMAERVFEWVRDHAPATPATDDEKTPDDVPWADGTQDRSRP
ncbi:MAG TPA: hypothetical protein VM118_14970 [Acidobacteriota bacterium]|nr:hypothetical protein [Acidobacteriota bacterium]